MHLHCPDAQLDLYDDDHNRTGFAEPVQAPPGSAVPHNCNLFVLQEEVPVGHRGWPGG